jgi:CheY-like chemotaxis protein
MKPAPVIIVDDEPDEHDLMKVIWEELKLSYPLISFTSGQRLIDYLRTDEEIPFLIICDIHLSAMDGFELRKQILENDSSKFKSVPFIFWSGSASESEVKEAYHLSSHGFFIKPSSFNALKDLIKDIIAYWHKSEIPLLHGKY